MSAVNTDEGTILEVLNNKSDRDLHNIDTTAKADAVIDYQIPTAENNYTWYRLYASGWVEQGGFATSTTTVTLPITMADTNYWYFIREIGNTTSSQMFSNSGYDATVNGFSYNNAAVTTLSSIRWQVSGMSASN